MYVTTCSETFPLSPNDCIMRSISFTFQSLITPTLIHKYSLYLSLYLIIINKKNCNKEVHVGHLQIRIVSQGEVCLNRVYLGSRLLFWVCLSTHPRGSTLYIFCLYHVSKRHMMSVHLELHKLPYSS